jgi:hypothetical protein
MTIKSETFEGTFPGAWQVADSDSRSGTYYWGKRACRAYQGGYSGWAVGGGNGTGLSCGSNYPTYVVGWMVYGPFSLTDATDAELTFQLWLHSELNYDGVFRGASINGDDFYGYSTTGNTGGWVSRQLDLTAVPTLGDLRGRSNVWIAIVFISDVSITYSEGAYVDNVLLRKYVGPGSTASEEALPPLPLTAHEEAATFSREP